MTKERELPKGLPHYEFIRDFTKDSEVPGLFHFMPRLNPVTEKPILTEDLGPDRRILSWKDIFDRLPERVEMEIGSGKGRFLVEYGKKHKDRCILGSEWDTSCAHYSALRLQKHLLDHCAVMRGDVYYFLRDRLPDNCVDVFHMYFPDPWPKTRQQKNRLLRPDFLKEVARVFKPGIRHFHWGTDHAEYNSIALEIFEATPGVRILKKNDAEPTDQIMTSFEIKYKREGRPIYRSLIEFSKPA